MAPLMILRTRFCTLSSADDRSCQWSSTLKNDNSDGGGCCPGIYFSEPSGELLVVVLLVFFELVRCVVFRYVNPRKVASFNSMGYYMYTCIYGTRLLLWWQGEQGSAGLHSVFSIVFKASSKLNVKLAQGSLKTPYEENNSKINLRNGTRRTLTEVVVLETEMCMCVFIKQLLSTIMQLETSYFPRYF